jgi:alkanesulfonate monooxygenase SsuD/methylene tetrahydromethanopterin reductase-like flavin-dependent oxidoreductase (luciferase family)
LHLVLDGSNHPDDVLAETAEVVLAATAPRPFHHRGVHWVIPADGHGAEPEAKLAVTPKPAQPELPIWLIGAGSVEAGRRFGLSHVVPEGVLSPEAAQIWTRTEELLGLATRRLRRPAVRELRCSTGAGFDAGELTTMLRAEADAWSLDFVLLHMPAGLDAESRLHVVRRLASLVRPHVQMQELPEAIHSYWRRELGAELSE